MLRGYLVDWSPLSASPIKDTPCRNPSREHLVNELVPRMRQLDTTCAMRQIQMHRSGAKQGCLLRGYAPMEADSHCSDFSEGTLCKTEFHLMSYICI